jgi:hypothetical protein
VFVSKCVKKIVIENGREKRKIWKHSGGNVVITIVVRNEDQNWFWFENGSYVNESLGTESPPNFFSRKIEGAWTFCRQLKAPSRKYNFVGSLIWHSPI